MIIQLNILNQMEKLIKNLILYICKHINDKDIISLSRVNKRYHKILREEYVEYLIILKMLDNRNHRNCKGQIEKIGYEKFLQSNPENIKKPIVEYFESLGSIDKYNPSDQQKHIDSITHKLGDESKKNIQVYIDDTTYLISIIKLDAINANATTKNLIMDGYWRTLLGKQKNIQYILDKFRNYPMYLTDKIKTGSYLIILRERDVYIYTNYISSIRGGCFNDKTMKLI